MLPHEKALLLAARGAAFAEDEAAAGRAVSFAEAVRHVEKHGYPPRGGAQTASFAEGTGGRAVTMFNVVDVLADELTKAVPGLSRGQAILRVAEAAKRLFWGVGGQATAGPADAESARSLLWLAAGSAGESDFTAGIAKVANSLRRVLFAGLPTRPAVASSAAPNGTSDPLAIERVATQVRKLLPRLSQQEALRFAARNPDT